MKSFFFNSIMILLSPNMYLCEDNDVEEYTEQIILCGFKISDISGDENFFNKHKSPIERCDKILFSGFSYNIYRLGNLEVQGPQGGGSGLQNYLKRTADLLELDESDIYIMIEIKRLRYITSIGYDEVIDRCKKMASSIIQNWKNLVIEIDNYLFNDSQDLEAIIGCLEIIVGKTSRPVKIFTRPTIMKIVYDNLSDILKRKKVIVDFVIIDYNRNDIMPLDYVPLMNAYNSNEIYREKDMSFHLEFLSSLELDMAKFAFSFELCARPYCSFYRPNQKAAPNEYKIEPFKTEIHTEECMRQYRRSHVPILYINLVEAYGALIKNGISVLFENYGNSTLSYVIPSYSDDHISFVVYENEESLHLKTKEARKAKFQNVFVDDMQCSYHLDGPMHFHRFKAIIDAMNEKELKKRSIIQNLRVKKRI
ncbi:MAG: hypothetical protein MHMPM18_002687 [Marteilia pararefringens]